MFQQFLCDSSGYAVQYVETASKQKERQRFREIVNRICREHSIEPAWVREEVIESQIIAMLENLALPREVYDWAMAYLEHTLVKDAADTEQELWKLKKRAADTQATLDTLLLKAAQTKDSLAEEFFRLSRQKQKESALLQQRIDQTEAGKQENGRDAAKIIELAQHLAEQHVTFPPPQRRQIVDSVFSNLQLENVNLCGNYRLPFSILAENHLCPLNSG